MHIMLIGFFRSDLTLGPYPLLFFLSQISYQSPEDPVGEYPSADADSKNNKL